MRGTIYNQNSKIITKTSWVTLSNTDVHRAFQINHIRIDEIIFQIISSLNCKLSLRKGWTNCIWGKMCSQLHFNIGVNRVILRSFLLSSRLAYEQEKNNDKYRMYSSYMCIEPFMLAHGCVRWAYPLVLLLVIYKRKLKNIIYGTTLSLNWYGNGSWEYLLLVKSGWTWLILLMVRRFCL